MKVGIYTNGAEIRMERNMVKKFARHSKIIYNHLNFKAYQHKYSFLIFNFQTPF